MNNLNPTEHEAVWALIVFLIDGIIGMSLALALSGLLGMKGISVAPKRFCLLISLMFYIFFLFTLGNPASELCLENFFESSTKQAQADAVTIQEKLTRLRRQVVDSFTKKIHSKDGKKDGSKEAPKDAVKEAPKDSPPKK